MPKTVLLATARGAVAVPFDVVVSKILPFAITLQRGRTSRSYAAFGGSDDDEHFRDDDGDADDDGSIAELTVRRCVKINFRRPTRCQNSLVDLHTGRPLCGGGRRLGRRREPLERRRRRRCGDGLAHQDPRPKKKT